MKHTPGPWSISDDDTRGLTTVVDAQGHSVATASVRFNRDMPMRRGETLLHYTARAFEAGERHANARLIAAAPDLLAALRDLLEIGGGEYREKARAAIEKAEGK